MHRNATWFRVGPVLLALLASSVTAQPNDPPAASPAESAPAPTASDEAAIAQLRAEIDAMLRPDGLVAPPSPDPGDEAEGAKPEQAPADAPRTRLEQIASKSNAIARQNLDQPDVQYQAQQVELRAYHALAQDAVINDRAAEASYRLTQLRNAANQARRSDNRFATATGDFWLLLADLIDINRNVSAVAQRQTKAAAKLEAFLADHKERDTPEPITTQVKAALIRLHTQSGRNARACELLAELREQLPPEDPRLVSLADAAAVCDLIGRRVSFEVLTESGQRWSNRELKTPVLVHVYADWSPQSVAVFDALASHAEALSAAKTRVISISVGPTSRGEADQPWALAEATPAEDGVAARLGVKGLPWLVLFDAEGRVAAVGQTQAVIDRALAMEDAAPVEAAKPSRDDPPSPQSP
ncbi:MAG: hypothetical protein GVY24_07500 [Planctomycetes bacterium]|nr:hypothetical protein [Planctomycetota bacterium]